MLLLTKVGVAFGDVSCPVCAQTFLVYRTEAAAVDAGADQRRLLEVLRQQHDGRGETDIHAPACPLRGEARAVGQRARRHQAEGGVPAFG